MFKKFIATTALVLTIVGCGGGSGTSSPTIATGQFKDSNTSGLKYVSGEQSGITGANGSFTYEIGQTVTFSIGGVALGASNGKAVVTPVDLVVSGSSSSTSVQNIVRFLMMLDSDADPANGISISSNVQAVAESWTQLDFSYNAAAFDSAASSVIASVAIADARTAALPSATTAQAHLESTLRCSYAGAFKGTYSGSDRGIFGAMVDARTGHVTGISYSILYDQYMTINGTTPITYDQSASFVTGTVGGGGQFTGQFTSVNSGSGTWANMTESGSFSGSRIGGNPDAVYRVTGHFSGDDLGLFSVDIDSANNATGVGYSILNDQEFTLSGNLVGTALSATASTGGTITGTFDASTGNLSGTWSSSNPVSSGSFSGSGCKLN